MTLLALLPTNSESIPTQHTIVTFESARLDQPDRDGTLQISSQPVSLDRYAVTEFPEELPGRAFRCQLASPSNNSDTPAVDVLLADRPPSDLCECPGFVQFGHCKHIAVLRTILEAGGLPHPLLDPELDTENTEVEDWARIQRHQNLCHD